MKLIIGYCTLLFLVSCNKSNHLGKEYTELVGVWKNTNGYYAPEIEFTKNGKLRLSFDAERGAISKIISLESTDFTYSSQGQNWRKLIFTLNNQEKFYCGISKNRDTLFAIGGSLDQCNYIDNFQNDKFVKE